MSKGSCPVHQVKHIRTRTTSQVKKKLTQLTSVGGRMVKLQDYLGANMSTMQVGDVCRLNEILPSIYKSDAWKTGLYRVKRIDNNAEFGKKSTDPRTASYAFEKIKKDGTVYKGFCNGYNCTRWDSWIASGKVTLQET
jgi:hypothetical protein